MNDEQREHLEELRHRYQQRLRVLEKRTAMLGINTPPEVEIEVQELRKQIADLEPHLGRSSKAIGLSINSIPSSMGGNRRSAWFIFGSLGVFALAFVLGSRLMPGGPGAQPPPTVGGAT